MRRPLAFKQDRGIVAQRRNTPGPLADEAKRRLFCGIKRSKVLIEEYRRRLLVLRGALPAPNDNFRGSTATEPRLVLSYPVRVTPTDDGLVMLTFHDVPEAVVVADGEEDAFARARAVLETVLGGYVLEGKSIPAPSDVCGAPSVGTEQFTTLGMIIP